MNVRTRERPAELFGPVHPSHILLVFSLVLAGKDAVYAGSVGYTVMENMNVRTVERPAELAKLGLTLASTSIKPSFGLLFTASWEGRLAYIGFLGLEYRVRSRRSIVFSYKRRRGKNMTVFS